MANIDDAFTIEALSLDDVVLIVPGTADPATGAGEAAPVGSLFLRSNGELYRKTGVNNVDWGKVGISEHADLSGIGTNTHAQIDSHLTSTINPHSTTVTNLQDTTISLEEKGDLLAYSGSSWVDLSVGTDGYILSANSLSVTGLSWEKTILDQDMASVLVGISGAVAIETTPTNILWDVVNVENNSSILEHDGVNTERLLIKESGLYFIFFSISFDADAGEETISAQAVIDDTTIIPGSLRVASEDDEINDLSNAITAELTAGEYITLQIFASGTGNNLHSSSSFSVTRAAGVKGSDGVDGADGDAGPPGSGSTILIEEEDVLVSNSPHSTINFIGMEATDAGSGQVDVENVFGQHFQKAESVGVTTTTSTTFLNKLSHTTTNLPAGKYRVSISYGWNHNSVSNDFEARFLEDSVAFNEIHKQEPKDAAGNFGSTGTSQRYYTDRTFYRDLSAGPHTYDFEFRTDISGTASSVWEVVLEIWRVS